MGCIATKDHHDGGNAKPLKTKRNIDFKYTYHTDKEITVNLVEDEKTLLLESTYVEVIRDDVNKNFCTFKQTMHACYSPSSTRKTASEFEVCGTRGLRSYYTDNWRECTNCGYKLRAICLQNRIANCCTYEVACKICHIEFIFESKQSSDYVTLPSHLELGDNF